MSRLVSLLIVLLAIAVATPVLAEDRLSLSGQMRVRGWHVDNDDLDRTSTWADQRLRIGGKMSIAEGVSATFRFDALESQWGSQRADVRMGFAGTPARATTGNIHFDRAHLDLDNGTLHLRAGQQYVSLGKSGIDNQSTGMLLNIKGAVPVSVFAMLDDDNGARNNSDGYTFGLNVGHKTDMYAANVYSGYVHNSSTEYKVYLLGVNYAQNFDMFKLFAEVDYFGGDINSNVDAYGLQAYVDASAAVADNVTIGGQFFYAMGDDDDVQVEILGNNFDGWDPIFDLGVGGGLENAAISYGRPFASLGNGAGIYAGRFYASVKATDDMTVSASAFYGAADEKDRADYKDVITVGAAFKYNFMPRTFFGAQVQYSDYSKENVANDLELIEVGTILAVSF